MIAITTTENLAGVRISGDYWDFNDLVEAMHQISNSLPSQSEFDGARLRVLSVCYDLRMAVKGESNIETTQNGITRSLMQEHEVIMPLENIYFSTEILWPELIFTVICLNDFLNYLSAKDPYITWKPYATTIRMFQSKTIQCLHSILTNTQFNWLQKNTLLSNVSTRNYVVQYIDLLNVEYLNTPIQSRAAQLPLFIQRILNKDEQYKHFETLLQQKAKKTKKELYTIPTDFHYPEKIVW